MSEEEQQAIGEIEKYLDYEGSVGIKSISILYTLFLKKQKEISLLKDQLEYVKSEYEETIEQQQKEIEYWKEQAEGYSDLAHQMKDDFENRDRGE